MSQSLFRANICVRKISIDSSIQAQGTGGFMSQKWRIYGLSDTRPGKGSFNEPGTFYQLAEKREEKRLDRHISGYVFQPVEKLRTSRL